MHGLRERVEQELLTDILPFWLKYAVDEEHGGFRGQIANDLTNDPFANKGLILNARILWTFARAFKVYRDDVYRKTAERAYDYLLRHFWDADLGGFYWMVDYKGHPTDTKKRIYGQAFAIYALAEYSAALSAREPVERAMTLFRLVDDASHDEVHGGYFETYERNWKLAAEQRLSDTDMDEKKSMNTQLHVLEAFSNLVLVSSDKTVAARLEELIQIFIDHILHPQTHHFLLFFDEAWRSRSDVSSFGHDIEGSWLLCEAARNLGNNVILKKMQKTAVAMAQAVYDQAIDNDGALLYEAKGQQIIDFDKHWWPQAEAVVGFLNAHELSGDAHFLQAAENCWKFIDRCIIDHRRGEWYWKVSRDGTPSDDKYKVDPWKCPYHNSRACFEVMQRLDKLAAHPRV